MNEIPDIENLLARSEQFETSLSDLLVNQPPDNDLRAQSVISAIDVASEHAMAIRVLIKNTVYTTAMSVFRLQYESVVRAVWLQHAATDGQIEKLMTTLSTESQQAASNSTPAYSSMMDVIKAKAPPGLYKSLQGFRDESWKTLNSFVHTGIHALNRSRTGYPAVMLEAVIRQSNNLSHIGALIFAECCRNQALFLAIVELHKQFNDCLQIEGIESSA